MSILVYPAVFGAAVVIGYLLYPLPWSLLKRRRYAEGGVIPKSSANSDHVPFLIAGDRTWQRMPDGWVDITRREHELGIAGHEPDCPLCEGRKRVEERRCHGTIGDETWYTMECPHER